MKNQEKQIKKAIDYLYFLLSKQDYSEKELRFRLKDRKQLDDDTIEHIISEFKKNNYINDNRMLENFVYSKSESFYGAKMIKQKAIQKKLNIDNIDTFLENIDFFKKAKEYKVNLFGEEKTEDFKTINKQKQKLLRRGFSFDEVNFAFGE